MKKFLGGLSVSLWLAALLFAPAPANAVETLYGNYSVQYFSCSQYLSTSPLICNYGFDEQIIFLGGMRLTMPLSSCAGSCSGTENMSVQSDIGNGRKKNFGKIAQCLNSYVIWLEPCNGC